MSAVEIRPRFAKLSSVEPAHSEEPNGEYDYGSLAVIVSGAVIERCKITRRCMYIGRSAKADLRLDSRYVSANHAMILFDESTLYIVDLHSTNETIVNGRPQSKKQLRHGDTIKIADFVLRYEAPAQLPLLESPRILAGPASHEEVRVPFAPATPLADTPPRLMSAVAARVAFGLVEQAKLRDKQGPVTDVPTATLPELKALDFDSLPDSDDAQSEVLPDAPEASSMELPAALPQDVPPISAAPESANATPAAEVLDDAALAVAIAEAEREGRSPLEVLEQTSGLDTVALTGELARVFAYPCLTGRELMALSADFELLPAAEARRRGCVILRTETGLAAVIADPFDPDLRPWLETRVLSPLRWTLVARGDLNAFISRHEQDLRAIDTALKGAHGESSKDNEVEELSLASINRDSSPVVKLVRSTLFDALRANASDVHLEAGSAQLEIRYRIDGVLVQIASVPGTEIAEQVISRIKVMSELDIAERRIPQDGRFKSSFNGRAIDFRVSIMPSTYGEDAVLRVLDKQAITDQLSDLRVDGLGFDPDVVESLRHLSALPHGMLLVTGPTGSGKTTTLYAAISETNTGMDKIVTIEDPVEYQLPGVLQIPVNEKKGLTFARGLRSILRHDPDKIMVGEIRDPETAQIAVQSALTGHLVFTTVHANNVFDVLSRFTHMGVDVYSFVAALNGILAQRLLRIVCEHCAEPVTATSEMLEATGLPLEEAQCFDFKLGRGCSHCRGTGYRGRRAVGELLVLNDELREAIVARVPVRQLKELAHKNHVRLIRTVALDLVRQGLTTIDEVNRVTAVS